MNINHHNVGCLQKGKQFTVIVNLAVPSVIFFVSGLYENIFPSCGCGTKVIVY